MKASAVLALLLALTGCAHHPEMIERYRVAHAKWSDCTVNFAVRHYLEGVDPQTSARLAMKMCGRELQAVIKAYAVRMDISLNRSASAYSQVERDTEETLVLLGIRQATLDDAKAAMLDHEPVPLEFR